MLNHYPLSKNIKKWPLFLNLPFFIVDSLTVTKVMFWMETAEETAGLCQQILLNPLETSPPR